MYPSFSKWIRSWRDLPLKLNQWNNVIRWEFKHPVPFLRTREFLWNELHTVLATEKEAIEEGNDVIAAYKDICENYMALYGMYGRKTEKEKFAGAVFSKKLHYIMPNGKSIEGPCFHHDGQKFAKAYSIKFLDENGKEQYAWQNTYAITTRMLGVMFAIHSDEKGLILPPKIAPKQVVIIPIIFESTKNETIKQAKKLASDLSEFSAFIDDRENYKAGFKFNEWELKGIPIRLELGPKDIEKKQVIMTRRDNGKKETVKMQDIKKAISSTLDDIQKSLFIRSERLFKSKVEDASTLSELKRTINSKKVAISPLCSNEECEDMIKYETGGAKTMFIASNLKSKNEKCIYCKNQASYFVYIGKSY